MLSTKQRRALPGAAVAAALARTVMLPDARDAYPSSTRCAGDVAPAPVDTFAADAVLSVNTDAEREERRDDARERARCRDHEHDDHLQPRRLLHVGAAEDRPRHHPWDRNDARHAAAMRISEGTRMRLLARRTSFG